MVTAHASRHHALDRSSRFLCLVSARSIQLVSFGLNVHRNAALIRILTLRFWPTLPSEVVASCLRGLHEICRKRRRPSMALHRFFCVSLLLLISLPAQSDIIRVPADQPTIQAGIDAADVGDQVLVASGTYTGPGNKDLELRGRDIVVSSEAGAPMTIIDCEGSGRGFNLFPPLTSAARIEGFTIKSGDGDGGSNQGGGGMYVVACSPTIAECIFEENVANGFL